MSLASVFLGFGLLLASVCFIVQPWRRHEDAPDEPAANGAQQGMASDLQVRRDAAYAALTELEFDHQVGKVNDHDYAAVRGQLMAEAVQTLQQLDAADQQIEREVESLVRRRRSAGNRPAATLPDARATVFCPACGKRLAPDARFCTGCGVSLSATCPACGRPLGSDDSFCRCCGAKVALPVGA